MSGGDYIRGKQAMSISAEALQHLQFQRFLGLLEQYPQICTSVRKIQGAFQQARSSPERERESKAYLGRVQGRCKGGPLFSAFREQGRNCNAQFLYWDNFLTQTFPVTHDLTCSH